MSAEVTPSAGVTTAVSRRALLLGVSFAVIALDVAPVHADFIEPISNAEKLMYATVRIVGKNAANEDVGGTAFFYKISLENDQSTTVLITNKHVIRDTGNRPNIDVHTRTRATGRPDGIASIQVDGALDAEWIVHPNRDIDLCAYMVQPKLNDLKPAPFFLSFEKNIIPSQKMLDDLDAIEEVIMIGYPALLYDQKNDYPIIRKGITASHPATDFNGKQETALDIPVFGGSSGSPVLIYNTGTYFQKSQNTTTIGNRIIFLGVLYGGQYINTKGTIEIREVPTIMSGVPAVITGNLQIPVMMNVGFIIKAAQIQPLIDTVTAKFGLKEKQ
jgi:hypothetical protein